MWHSISHSGIKSGRIDPSLLKTRAFENIAETHTLASCPHCDLDLVPKLKTEVTKEGNDWEAVCILCNNCCIVWGVRWRNNKIYLSAAAFCFCRTNLIKNHLVNSEVKV